MKNRKLIIFVLMAIIIVLCNHYFHLADLFTENGSHALKSLVKENFLLAALLYLAFTVIGSVLLALPGVSFAILAGILFGPITGTLLCLTGASLGAIAAFLAARFFLKESLRPRIMKNPYLRRWLFEESGRNVFFTLMLTRLIPLFPYNLQNFAYGITDISFAAYSLGSFIFMLPGTAVYTLAACGLMKGKSGLLYLVMALILFLLAMISSRFLKMKYVLDKDN